MFEAEGYVLSMLAFLGGITATTNLAQSANAPDPTAGSGIFCESLKVSLIKKWMEISCLVVWLWCMQIRFSILFAWKSG